MLTRAKSYKIIDLAFSLVLYFKKNNNVKNHIFILQLSYNADM